MIDEKKKMTTQDSSVGADDGQSISKNSDISIRRKVWRKCTAGYSA